MLVAGWAAFAVTNIGLMFAFSGAETIPFHLVWITFALIYGIHRPWSDRLMLATLTVITVATGLALIHSWSRGFIGLEELSEIPLMAALFLVMVWHVKRHQTALEQVEEMVAGERRRKEALALFVRQGSHELRTPITVARGYTDLILATHRDPQTAEDGRIVLDELAKLERITARLLTLLVVDSVVALEMVDLDDHLERIMRRWVPTAARRWEVRSTVGRLAISVDRFDTAIDSLLENAVKFTTDFDLVGMYASRVDGEVIIDVRDTGRGIPAAEIPHVFEHFTTGSNAAEQAGTGLGLSIVKAAVTGRGGTVEVTSSPAEGTTFRLRLPEEPPRDAHVPSPVESSGDVTVRRRRVAEQPLPVS